MAGLAVGSTPSRMVIPLHRLLNIRLTSAALISVAHRADLSLTAPVTCRALFDVGCGPRLRGRNNLKTCATLSSLWRIQAEPRVDELRALWERVTAKPSYVMITGA
jgi:hypothetical protein